MSETSYTQVLREAKKLSRNEQLLLVSQLVGRLRSKPVECSAHLRWEDYAGVGAEIRSEEDPQEWVTRTRRESDEARRIP